MFQSLDNEKPLLNDSILQGIKERTESYLSTIYALHAFILAVKKTIKVPVNEFYSSIGRRMHYLDGKSKRDFCTPDVIVQLNTNKGIIGEAKLLICQNKDDNWEKYLKQVKRYDKDLVGWWTPNELIDETSIVLITELTFSSLIGDYFQNQVNSNNIKINHPFAVVEFSRHQKAREYLFLRTRTGELPEEIAHDFRNGVEIPVETLIFENEEKKFYDAKPSDIEYVMDVLWQNIFTKEALSNEGGKSRYDETEKVWRITINVDSLTANVQRLYGSVGGKNREVEYPQKAWIKDALEKFVAIGLAKPGSNTDEYIILYKKFPRPMEKFIKLIHKQKKDTKTAEKQLELFDLSNEDK